MSPISYLFVLVNPHILYFQQSQESVDEDHQCFDWHQEPVRYKNSTQG